MLLLPLLLLPFKRAWWTMLVAPLPALSLAAIGLAAWYRGAVGGLWLAPWELLLLLAALALAYAGLRGEPAGRSRKPKTPRQRKGR